MENKKLFICVFIAVIILLSMFVGRYFNDCVETTRTRLVIFILYVLFVFFINIKIN